MVRADVAPAENGSDALMNEMELAAAPAVAEEQGELNKWQTIGQGYNLPVTELRFYKKGPCLGAEQQPVLFANDTTNQPLS